MMYMRDVSARLHTLSVRDCRAQGQRLRRWRRSSRRLPSYFRTKFRSVTAQRSVFALLIRIRKELFRLYGKRRDYARSLADSRLTPISQMLKRRMASCGALALIFATVLRHFGIPVKLVHGRIRGTQRGDRHAWLKIFDPEKRKWLTVDPTRPDFFLSRQAYSMKNCADWTDLKLRTKRSRVRDLGAPARRMT